MTPQPVRTVIYNDFSAWTTTGTGAFTAADTTDFVYGSASAKVVSTGGGAFITMRKIAGTAVNMTSKAFTVLAKMPATTNATEFSFYAGTGSFAAFRNWSFLQAANAQVNTQNAGGWYWFTFLWDDYSSQTGVPDRTALTDFQFRAVDDNTGVPVTLQIGAICSIPQSVTTYASGVCTFTFDDGWSGWSTYAGPYMDKYGWSGTGYLITDAVGTGNYCTLAQLKQLESASGWEMGAHAFTGAHHGLAAGMTSLSDVDYEVDIINQINWLKANGFTGYKHMAWPQGYYNPAKLAIAKKYFDSARTTFQQNRDTVPAGDQYRLRWYSIGPSTVLATVQAEIDKAVTAKSWLNLTVHDIATSPTGVQVSVANFNSICDYVSTRMPVRTVSQVLNSTTP